MNAHTMLLRHSHYRLDVEGLPTLRAIDSEVSIAVRDIAIGTEFCTSGSTPLLRTQFDVRHAHSLTLQFDERGVAYFSSDRGEHIDLVHCADLRLTVVDVPYMEH